jgi:Flp pilus assembly protein TadB
MADARDDEIARIEKELARFRSQQANLRRSARFFLPFCVVVGAAVVVFLAYSVAIGNTAAIITAVLVLIALIGLAVASRHERFLIVLSSPLGRGRYPYGSHAEFLDGEIAKREKRLSELKARS